MANKEKNNIQSEAEKKELFKKELKEKAMAKLTEAIKLNKQNNLSKESREAKAEACALILMAMRAEVHFDPNDPMFQIFVQKQSWRNAMKRACKEVCDKGTDLCRKTMDVLKSISLGIVNVGDLSESVINIFSKHGVKPLEAAEVVNEDNWSDFYEEIPKDGGNGGNGPSVKHNSKTMEAVQTHKKTSDTDMQALLSSKVAGSKPHENITNKDFYDFLLKEIMSSYKKAPNGNFPKSFPKKVVGPQSAVWSKNRGSSNAA